MTELKKIKTITSHTGLAQFIAECEEEPVGYLSRAQTKHIPSPYRHSPSADVVLWRGKQVVWFETRHRRFEVFQVPEGFKVFADDGEAADHYIASFAKTA